MSEQAACEVEVTGTGYLVLDAEVARSYFPHDTLLVMLRGRELWLLPTRGAAGGGLLLKQRNTHGDRSVLVREALGDELPVGRLPAFWDSRAGALRCAALPLPLPSQP